MIAGFMSALVSARVETRFPVLWLTGIGLNLAAWAAGCRALPEGVLRGILPAPNVIPDAGTLTGVFSRVLVYNLVVAAGLIAVANLFRVGRVPLGYVPALFHWTAYGLFLGTNSFGKIAERSTSVSLPALLASPGFVELTAYTLVAASTAGIAVFMQQSWFTLKTRKIRNWRDVNLTSLEITGLIAALVLLVNGAWREAIQIVGR